VFPCYPVCLPVTKSICYNELCQVFCVSMCLCVTPCYSVFKYIAVISAVNSASNSLFPFFQKPYGLSLKSNGQNCYRNFSKSLTPPFLLTAAFIPRCYINPQQPPPTRTPAPRPRLCATPWGTPRTTPTQGRSTFTTSVLRRRYNGGLYCPSPSPPGFPLLKDKIGGVYSLRFTTLRSGRKPVLSRLNGGGAAPGRSRGPKGIKKRKRPCLRFFPLSRLPASPPLYRRNGAYFAHPDFRLPITHSAISPTAS
jgi:hypothetical protein